MQRTNTLAKKGVLIYFNLKNVCFEANLVDFQGDFREMCKLLDCDLINVVKYNDEVDIIVDDTGLLKSGNPVLEVDTPYGTRQLAGKLLFLKSEMTDEGVINTGMDYEQALALIAELHDRVSLIGVTN